VLSLLSYMCKAPLVKPGMCSIQRYSFLLMTVLVGTGVVNSLNRQRNALEAFLKACVGLESNSDLLLETRIW
jgi:myo-inositol-1-phosphate synthase